MEAVLSLGSNIEPRAEYLSRALRALEGFPGTRLLRASSVAETQGEGVPEEYAHMKFLNQVAVFGTSLEVHDFSRRMHAVEDALGRVRTVRNGPRTIDIDLVDFGGMRLDEPDLVLPHPRAHERDFVMRLWEEVFSAAAGGGLPSPSSPDMRGRQGGSASDLSGFSCRRCGACCRIKDGIVRVDADEIARISAFLGMDETAFIEHEAELSPDRKSLMLRSRADGRCVYLSGNNLCRINPVKPEKCRTFPHEWKNPDSFSVCPALRRSSMAGST